MAVKEIKILYSDEWRKGDGIKDPIRKVHRFYTHDGELLLQLWDNEEFKTDDIINRDILGHIFHITLKS